MTEALQISHTVEAEARPDFNEWTQFIAEEKKRLKQAANLLACYQLAERLRGKFVFDNLKNEYVERSAS